MIPIRYSYIKENDVIKINKNHPKNLLYFGPVDEKKKMLTPRPKKNKINSNKSLLSYESTGRELEVPRKIRTLKILNNVKIHSKVTELDAGMVHNISIPFSVQKLNIDTCHLPKLPKKLKYLQILESSEDEILPQSIVDLRIEWYNQDLCYLRNLETLIIFNLYPTNSKVDIYEHDLKFPNSVKKLELMSHHGGEYKYNITLPNELIYLKIQNTKDIFIDIKGKIPINLKHVELDRLLYHIDCSETVVETMIIKEEFLFANSMPYKSLIRLEIGKLCYGDMGGNFIHFNVLKYLSIKYINVSTIILPESLEFLNISDCDNVRTNIKLNNNLKYLQIGGCFSMPLILPLSLDVLVLGIHFKEKITYCKPLSYCCIGFQQLTNPYTKVKHLQ